MLCLFVAHPHIKLLPFVMSSIVAERLSRTEAENHWVLREKAAVLLRRILDKYGPKYHNLRSDIFALLETKLKAHHLPASTRYGVIAAIAALGDKAIRRVSCKDFHMIDPPASIPPRSTPARATSSSFNIAPRIVSTCTAPSSYHAILHQGAAKGNRIKRRNVASPQPVATVPRLAYTYCRRIHQASP